MAIKELFQDSRPQVLFDPRASRRVDPRFKFTRNGVASYSDEDGVLRVNGAAANEPRFDYDPITREIRGLLVEKSSTNYIRQSIVQPDTDGMAYTFWTEVAGRSTITANAGLAPDGTMTAGRVTTVNNQPAGFVSRYEKSLSNVSGLVDSIWLKSLGPTYTLALYGSPNREDTITPITVTNQWQRFEMRRPPTVNYFLSVYRYTGDLVDILAWGAQTEISDYASSYIPTSGTATFRPPDLLSIEGTSLPSTGSIYVDARSLSSNVNATLLSAANASNDKLTLAIRQPASLYNSKALVYEVDGAFKPTLPFPVPTDARERNLITYGANNYHYRSDSSRLTPSSSSRVPADMNRLGIGHDVTDPTKAITGYINTVYLWPGEITPTVAEALVRGDLDPQDADAGVFTPEAGALAFVFNTQGTATDGDKVVQLPFGGNTNNVLVDWGDNTSSSFIGAAADSTVSHTYPSAGIYPVQITADSDGTNSGLENLQFYNNSPADLVSVLQWGGTTTWNPTTMYRAFRNCTQLDFENAARINLPDTSAITNWEHAFYNCSSLSGLYPNFNHSAATTLRGAWFNCSSITSFGSSLDDISTVTDYYQAWENCSSIDSFPSITIPTDQGAVNLSRAWRSCTDLTSAGFPFDIDTSAVTNFQESWYNCTSLTYFSTLNLSNGTTFTRTWFNCTSLTSFTITNFASAESLASAFYNWPAFTGTFPTLTTSTALTNLGSAWRSNNMTVFNPPTVTSQVTNMSSAWRNCNGLTVFPSTMDTSACENFFYSWSGCSGLTEFPSLDFDSALGTWVDSSTSFDGFRETWFLCSNLETFPANMFNNVNTNNFYFAFKSCALTAASIENIIVSIAAAASTNSLNNGYLSLDGGTNAAEGTWTAAATTALGELEGLGWTVDRN